jgi:beta-glucanase (GH16 family)
MKLSASFLYLWVGACSLLSTDAETPIWSDEFNNDGPPDPNFWSYDLGDWGWGNSELQMYTSNPENVKVANGKLTIAARQTGQQITSARIKTLSKVTVKYGRIESRIKFPNLANGLWPAFWTLGQNFRSVGWPQCGEMDIMEMGNVDGINAGVVNRRVGSAAHWDNFGTRATYGLYYDPPADLIGEFHNFTMNWTPELVSTYVDDDLIWEIDISEEACLSCTAFHKPHFILLNLAVGGIYTGIYNNQGITAPMPSEYIIDYVRVYENEWTEMGGTYFVPPETLSDCGCAETCTASVLDQIATDTTGSYSCRDRITWQLENLLYSEEDACATSSREFPDICGKGCNPYTCNGQYIDVVDCGCGSQCVAALDNMANVSFSCRDRMLWLMEFLGQTEQEACAQVSTEFPTECGLGCDSELCVKETREPSSQPTALPTTSSAPSISAAPSMTPSVSPMPSVLSLDCGCGSSCGASNLDQIVTILSGSYYSCLDRIMWTMENLGKSEQEACSMISSEFPTTCGQGCNPGTCNTIDCGCGENCKTVLDQIATDNDGSFSCRDRVIWVMQNLGYDEETACSTVSTDFPSICGQGCDPATCSSQQVGNCGCGYKCESVLDQIVTDSNGSSSCRDRVNWVMENLGYDEEAACNTVSAEFPTVCGVCTPTTCSTEGLIIEDCGCGDKCESVLDRIITDNNGSFSCRDRMNWVMKNLGYDEETACSTISADFLAICGTGCDPATCNKVSPTPTIDPSELPSASPTYQPSRFPSHAPTLSTSSSPPSKSPPVGGQTLNCGCGSNCHSATLNRIATDNSGSHSCRARIIWLRDVAGKPETDACVTVSSEFPSICGQGCDPRNCNRSPPPTVVDCGCPSECTSSVLDRPATDGAGPHSCRARINFVMGNYGKSEEEACKQVAFEFPSICGQGCEPLICN